MGLLDEAIREHLELKRRRGADPTEIARAEREALEPVFPGEHPRSTEPESGEGEPTAPVEHGDAVLAADPPPVVDPGFSTLGQETAELDVEAYMDGVDGAASVAEVAPAEMSPPPVEAPGVIGDEMLDWEEPQTAQPEPPPEQIPGQERLSLE